MKNYSFILDIDLGYLENEDHNGMNPRGLGDYFDYITSTGNH